MEEAQAPKIEWTIVLKKIFQKYSHLGPHRFIWSVFTHGSLPFYVFVKDMLRQEPLKLTEDAYGRCDTSTVKNRISHVQSIRKLINDDSVTNKDSCLGVSRWYNTSVPRSELWNEEFRTLSEIQIQLPWRSPLHWNHSQVISIIYLFQPFYFHFYLHFSYAMSSLSFLWTCCNWPIQWPCYIHIISPQTRPCVSYHIA